MSSRNERNASSQLLLPAASTSQPTHQSPKERDQACNKQKRPMNAFLMFCKKHRKLVKTKHPTLENRDITRVLGELWSKLDRAGKRSYIELAKQYKEIYIRANPEFRWCNTRFASKSTGTMNQLASVPNIKNGNESSVIHCERNIQMPKPPKKRYSRYNMDIINNSCDTRHNDGLVMLFDQDNIGKAIENALSDSTKSNPSDFPVDFSMKRTLKATRQTIISNIIDNYFHQLNIPSLS